MGACPCSGPVQLIKLFVQRGVECQTGSPFIDSYCLLIRNFGAAPESFAISLVLGAGTLSSSSVESVSFKFRWGQPASSLRPEVRIWLQHLPRGNLRCHLAQLLGILVTSILSADVMPFKTQRC